MLPVLRSTLGLILLCAPLFPSSPARLTTGRSSSLHPTQLDAIVVHARQAQLEAQEVGRILRSRAPDFAAVKEKVEVLDHHVLELRNLIAAAEPGRWRMSPAARRDFDLMKDVAESLARFVADKREVIDSGDGARQRAVLRAKADRIVQRVEVVKRSARKLRG